MKLMIAEKPSVARAIASVVGADSRGDGYLEGSGWVVTWCRGHLVDLCRPDAYEQWAGAWDLAKLPMLPDPWKWAPAGSDAEERLSLIKELAERPDVTEIVNACDADREGEGIFRRVYEFIQAGKPVKRFWSTSLVDDAVRKDLAGMRPWAEYEGLGLASEGRAKADWLVGMNGTRAYTKVYGSGKALSVGRVQTPVLAMVVDQTRRVEDFVVEPFWRVAVDLGGFEVSSARFDDRGGADALAEKASCARAAVVKRVERKDVKAKAPTLYDLSSLQRDASSRCGLTAEETLKALQSLYEAKLATYPRTDSRYITSDDAAEAAALLPLVSRPGIAGDGVARCFDPERADVSRVVNDAEVSGHGAVLPTTMLVEEAMSRLEGAERSVMTLVCCRLLAAVMEPGVRTHSKIEVEIAGEVFTASGSVVKDASWIAVDDACKDALKGGSTSEDDPSEDRMAIPGDIAEGSELDIVDVSVKEGKTTPPKPFTDATLLSAMEHAGRMVADDELRAAIDDDSSHSGGLGTPATRADTIERIIARGYAERKGRSILATEKGKDLIATVSDSLKTPTLTAKWESQLSEIEHGRGSLDAFLSGIEGYAGRIVREAIDEFDPDLFKEASCGTCPLCGKPVVPSKSGTYFKCVDQRWGKTEDGTFFQAGSCPFTIGKVAGKRLTEKQVASLLSGAKVRVSGLVKKAGGTFSATLVLNRSTGAVDFVKEPGNGNKRKKG